MQTGQDRKSKIDTNTYENLCGRLRKLRKVKGKNMLSASFGFPLVGKLIFEIYKFIEGLSHSLHLLFFFFSFS